MAACILKLHYSAEEIEKNSGSAVLLNPDSWVNNPIKNIRKDIDEYKE